MRIAVLDLGTNTFNLIIAEKKNHSIHILHNSKQPVKLGEGGINRGEIVPEAIQRGIHALNIHYKTIKQMNVNLIKAFGTSALRTAKNGSDFKKNIEEIIKNKVEIISGTREAELIYYGVRQTLDMGANKYLILDIGGGSNEFIIADGRKIYWKKSYKLGIARLIEKFKPSDPITPQEIKTIENYIRAETTDLAIQAGKYNITKLIGASGSFETFENMIRADDKNTVTESALHARAIEIKLPDFEQLCQKLIASTYKERESMPGLESMRIEMIVLAALFVKFITQILGITKIVQVNFSLKEGAIYELLND